MNFGFVINNRTCIGCHACSTACKSENEVPLGVSRTWVKYVEAGTYPHTKRHFQVTRCNHCENPPCTRICPVTAMYQRDDGIVEFDPNVCIGCKACMQACPYDAIHVDPNTKTVAKCHYCAHRVDIGLEPACVVVCPEHAIIAGDIDNPESEIAQVLAKEKTSVRKPEQGTGPKLFYVDGHDLSMHPTATTLPQTFMWADVLGTPSNITSTQAPAKPVKKHGLTSASGSALRRPHPQGEPAGGPIRIAGRLAEHMVQVGYNAQHKVPWHWQVPAYLVTKAIAAGWFTLYAMGVLFGLIEFSQETAIAGGLTALGFVGLTTMLLVADLERPERFFWILIRPQWRSWLTRGAVILIGFSTLLSIWLTMECADYFQLITTQHTALFRPYLFGIGVVFAIGTAIYTAFLFGQAEGRDLWQSGLLPIHLLVQSGMAGAATMLIIDLVSPASAATYSFAITAFVTTLLLDLFVTFFGEFGMPHMTDNAAKAAHEITRGAFKQQFWWGAIALGHILPLGLLLTDNTMAAALAGATSLIGLYFFEHAFVMAPQRIPNS